MERLKRVEDLTQVNWIRENVLSLEGFADRDGNYVEHCIPNLFEAYCKIFHNIYEDPAILDKQVTWDEVDKQKPADLDDPVQKALAGATTVYGGEDDLDYSRLKRVRWAELAERYNISFHPDINVDSFSRNFPTRSWPRYLIGPGEGMPEISTCKEIVRSIATDTSDFGLSERCFFFYDLIATLTYESDLLFTGPLECIFETYQFDETSGAPTYWWPIERTWLVCSDWDLPFTLVGGSAQLVQSLLSNPELESTAVQPTSRIDFKSDTLNP